MPNLSIDLLTIVIALGIAQGLFLSFIIVKVKGGNHSANKLLALLVLFFSLSITSEIVGSTGLYRYLPHLLHTNAPFLTLFGPTFYFYVKELTNYKYSLTKKDILHLVPFAISIIILIPIYKQTGAEKISKADAFISGTSMLDRELDLIWIFSQIQMWIYLYFVWRIIKKHQSLIKDNFSSIERINLSWIKYFIYGLIVVFVFCSFLTFLFFFGFNQFDLYRIIMVIASIAIYALGYRGLNQPAIFTQSDFGSNTPTKKYEKSSLSKHEMETYKKEIIKIMEYEKLYRNPNLTVEDLASNLNIIKNHVSQTINQTFNMNFYDFVNKYRVEEVKKEIEISNEKINFLELAINAGFNSKSTFNTAFKKYTSVTPSEYKNQVLQKK